MSDELKPCPKCGSPAEMRHTGENANVWQVRCTICETTGPAKTTTTDAGQFWNGLGPVRPTTPVIDAVSITTERDAYLLESQGHAKRIVELLQKIKDKDDFIGRLAQSAANFMSYTEPLVTDNAHGAPALAQLKADLAIAAAAYMGSAVHMRELGPTTATAEAWLKAELAKVELKPKPADCICGGQSNGPEGGTRTSIVCPVCDDGHPLKKKERELPAWWPQCPYGESVFTMTEEEYVFAVPHPQQRTAISGFLMRLGWNVASKDILERIADIESELAAYRTLAETAEIYTYDEFICTCAACVKNYETLLIKLAALPDNRKDKQ